ncbi:MAG: hypothetical protein K2X69_04065 [Silvanigrellaceae bacterium]|nr:hypothetical protein [Silvanigrellaceae bacterium]
MKKLFLLLVFVTFSLFSCTKETSSNLTKDKEVEEINSFIGDGWRKKSNKEYKTWVGNKDKNENNKE